MNPSAAPRTITLTTDFGLSDHYVGTLKGVLVSRAPAARIVDISHEVPAFSLYAAAYTIAQSAPYFPPGTIHVVIIDPGVGTARKPILIEASGQYFIAPDNGVLSLIVSRDPGAIARELANRAFWLESPSSTFHGRDIFVPVAAALASGASAADVGPVLSRIELLPDLHPQLIAPHMWQGKILSVDHFGNIITNFPAAAFRVIASEPFSLQIGNREITAFRQTFGLAEPGLCFAYFGSSGYVEAGLNQASAAGFLNAIPGASIHLTLSVRP